MTLFYDSQIANRLDKAERNVRCLFSRSRNDGRRLMNRALNGKVTRVQPGYFARSAYWGGLDVQQRFAHVLRASAKRHPHIIFAGFAAAFAFGLDVPKDRLMHVRPRDLVLPVQCPDFIYLHGYRVSPLPHALFDCAGAMTFPESLALMDSAFRGYRGLGKANLLEQFQFRGTRSAGFRRAIKALKLADATCLHPDLSYARGAIYELGFSMPELEGACFCWKAANGTAVQARLVGRSKRYGHVTLQLPAEDPDNSPCGATIRLTPELVNDPAELTEVLARAGVPLQP